MSATRCLSATTANISKYVSHTVFIKFAGDMPQVLRHRGISFLIYSNIIGHQSVTSLRFIFHGAYSYTGARIGIDTWLLLRRQRRLIFIVSTPSTDWGRGGVQRSIKSSAGGWRKRHRAECMRMTHIAPCHNTHKPCLSIRFTG